MIEELYVENLGIIAASRIEPGPGLVAVTGETGAGKTLLVGALRLLRGDPARADRVGPRAAEARVEGRFSFGEEEVVIARRVTEGRSRAYLDGAMVPARVLAKRLESLVEIVAQHERLALAREAPLRRLVDGALDDSGMEAAAAYRAAWDRLSGLRTDRDHLGGDARALARDLDLARHEARQIAAAGVIPGEDEELKATLTRARHAGEITEALVEAAATIEEEGGAADLLRAALSRVRSARALDATLDRLEARIAGALAEVEEAAIDLHASAEAVEHDPDELRRMEERAAMMADLKRKYGATLEEVIAFGEEAAARAERLASLARRAETIGAEIEEATDLAVSAGESLAEARRLAAKDLVGRAQGFLRQLGFGDPVLSLDVTGAAPGPWGADRIGLTFASDAGLTPGPITRVASGGELSRLVLAVRVAAGVADADVVAFDEIDAGVGGATALAMGEMLARLSSGRQVLIVTHLPQVAAFADRHFVVDREENAATVRRVEGAERLAELARMLGGLEESKRGRGHAEELLALAGERKTG